VDLEAAKRILDEQYKDAGWDDEDKYDNFQEKLKEEIAGLKADYKKLDADKTKADSNRKEEKAENANTVSEAKIGKQAVATAMDILNKFYKTAGKATVAYSLSQGPLDDAPDAGFDNGEAYQGAGAESGGIIGMMEVIESDFDRTIEETTKAEESAAEEHLQFMTESESSLAEKSETLKSKKKLKDETDSDFSDAQDELDSQVSLLKTSIKELIELKKSCVETGMSYADREALREEEIDSLKKALCILASFSEYGSDGVSKTEDC
jgi:DNA repair exonuclease SbcCD ATPase subunit